MKAVVFSLGCKVNSYESQAIINLLIQMGFSVSDKPEYADIYILNTCSVTSEADKKSRQAVERLKKFNRNARILVLGCSVQNSPDRYLCNDAITAVSGVGGKIDAVKRFVANTASKERNFCVSLPGLYEDNFFPAATKTRSYVKIQDGCDNFCSYCKIPYLRGRSRSRKMDSIIKEAWEVSSHSKEIILTGINVSDYYSCGNDLTTLVYALKDIPARKRLSSFECEIINEKFLLALKESGFCDHFHLSLQSGSDNVLKRMNRHYTVEEYLEKVELIYSVFPSAAITTDMIAGFPTETEEDHLIGMETARRAKFAAIHVFPYSEREGTIAAKLPQIDKVIRTRRAAELIKLSGELKDKFISANLGQEAEVYAETEDDKGISEGFTTNYIKVYSPLKAGEIGKVRLVSPHSDGVKGELI